jgi:hypothetical protein
MRKAQQTRSLVAAWFDFLPPKEHPVAQALHEAVRAGVPELGETIRQGNLLMLLDGEPLLAIAPVADQVHLLIFNGSALEATFGRLDGVGRRQRVVRFSPGHPVDSGWVESLARASADFARRHRSFDAR